MIYTLVKLTVADWPTFLREYSELVDVQYRAQGWQRSEVFRVVDKENQAILLLLWDDRAAVERFLKDPTVWQTMKGISDPEITFLKNVGEFSL